MLQGSLIEVKDAQYYRYARSEMVAYVPVAARRILDVGCGEGRFGDLLKQQRPGVQVAGVEPVEECASRAAQRLDRVWIGEFGPALQLPAGAFDCIVFNDVLEHMIDPWAALRYARELLSPGGCVVASIPNIRHFPTVYKLVVRGSWDYRSRGTLDRTHLRFFTRASIVSLFQETGYRIEQIEGINRYAVNSSDEYRLWRVYNLLRMLAFGRMRDMGYLQFAVRAAPNHQVG